MINTNEEMEDRFHELPEDIQKQVMEDEPINPKVINLVVELNKAGITTIMSGDLYTEEFVYVDMFDDEFKKLMKIHNYRVPKGWTVTYAFAKEAMEGARRKEHDEEVLYGGTEKVRLIKVGSFISREEAQIIAFGKNEEVNRKNEEAKWKKEVNEKNEEVIYVKTYRCSDEDELGIEHIHYRYDLKINQGKTITIIATTMDGIRDKSRQLSKALSDEYEPLVVKPVLNR